MKTLKFFSAVAMMALVATTVACKDNAKKAPTTLTTTK